MCEAKLYKKRGSDGTREGTSNGGVGAGERECSCVKLENGWQGGGERYRVKVATTGKESVRLYRKDGRGRAREPHNANGRQIGSSEGERGAQGISV